MTRPLSNDLRVRLIDAVAQGMSCRAAANRFGVAASTAVKLVRRWRLAKNRGSSLLRPHGSVVDEGALLPLGDRLGIEAVLRR
jgi:transposase